MASSNSKQKSPEDSGELLEADLEDADLEDADLDEVIGDEPIVDSSADEDFDDDESTPKAKKVKHSDDDDDDDDEEEDLEPEDMEADLDAILRDRMATSDDGEEESEGVNAVSSKGPAPADIVTCSSCFLGVNRSQLDNQEYCPHCGDQLVGA